MSLAAIAGASLAAFVGWHGGSPLSLGMFAWLAPAVVGGLLAGALHRRVGATLSAGWWLLVPVAVAWPFLLGRLVGWPPVYCLGWWPSIALVLVPFAQLGWYAPLSASLAGPEHRRWRAAAIALAGLPLGYLAWSAFYFALNTWSHGEFTGGGGGGG
ncbi:MAG: hypothetical protein Q8P41_15360 [Pseudomonadota bacterium]|nr:hypothetical protein [Pseudomonadota bacterium]